MYNKSGHLTIAREKLSWMKEENKKLNEKNGQINGCEAYNKIETNIQFIKYIYIK